MIGLKQPFGRRKEGVRNSPRIEALLDASSRYGQRLTAKAAVHLLRATGDDAVTLLEIVHQFGSAGTKITVSTIEAELKLRSVRERASRRRHLGGD